jgi:hypothetical protein
MSAVLERSFQSSLVNDLVNRPDIRPFVGGDTSKPLDLSQAIEDENNIALLGDFGGFVMIWCAPGTYEVHTMITEDGRGEWALDAARTGIAILADAYGARHLWTRVKPEARNVRTFTIAAGMKPCGQKVFDIGAGPEAYNIYEWRAS